MAFKDIEVGRLAYDAGIHDATTLAQAIAIAKAESGFNPTATNSSQVTDKWGPAVGLWQIRSIKAESGTGSIRDAKALILPSFNAKAMFDISNGGKNWSPWQVWPLIAAPYILLYAPTATAVLAEKKSGDVVGGAIAGAVDTASNAATALADISSIGKAAYNWSSDRNNWVRVAKVMIGGALLVGGAYLLTRPVISQTVATVGKAM